jgi:hypothetical protein
LGPVGVPAQQLRDTQGTTGTEERRHERPATTGIALAPTMQPVSHDGVRVRDHPGRVGERAPGAGAPRAVRLFRSVGAKRRPPAPEAPLPRTRTVRGVLAVLASTALLAGCTSGPAGPIAAVEGVEIPREAVEGWVRAAVQSNPSVDPVGLQVDLVSRVIQLQILEGILAERALTIDPELRRSIREDIEVQVGGQASLIATLADIGFSEAFFDDVFLQFEAGIETLVLSLAADLSLETRTSRHILVPTADEAEEVYALLLEGADFAELALERSQDPGSGSRGGDLGPQLRGTFVPPFDEAVWSARVGVVLEPVESQFGFHVIEVTSIDRTAAADLQPDQRRQLVAEELRAIVEGAFLAASVTVDPTIGTWDPASGSVRPA